MVRPRSHASVCMLPSPKQLPNVQFQISRNILGCYFTKPYTTRLFSWSLPIVICHAPKCFLHMHCIISFVSYYDGQKQIVTKSFLPGDGTSWWKCVLSSTVVTWYASSRSCWLVFLRTSVSLQFMWKTQMEMLKMLWIFREGYHE